MPWLLHRLPADKRHDKLVQRCDKRTPLDKEQDRLGWEPPKTESSGWPNRNHYQRVFHQNDEVHQVEAEPLRPGLHESQNQQGNTQPVWNTQFQSQKSRVLEKTV